jgi:hypothetical protein
MVNNKLNGKQQQGLVSRYSYLSRRSRAFTTSTDSTGFFTGSCLRFLPSPATINRLPKLLLMISWLRRLGRMSPDSGRRLPLLFSEPGDVLRFSPLSLRPDADLLDIAIPTGDDSLRSSVPTLESPEGWVGAEVSELCFVGRGVMRRVSTFLRSDGSGSG